jgi:hypothetical protein
MGYVQAELIVAATGVGIVGAPLYSPSCSLNCNAVRRDTKFSIGEGVAWEPGAGKLQ